MSKNKRTNGFRTAHRRMTEGRGLGRGDAYTPWLKIHDVASHGQANRVRSPINGRTCHMLSKLETDWFQAFHAVPGLVDIREQLPLELEETREIASSLGIAHPTDPQTKEPCVATTDFVLTVKDGIRMIEMAFAIKPAAQLASPRTLEKLEIERVYWSARKISWRILTEKELPVALVKNLSWLQPFYDLSHLSNLSPEELNRFRTAMEPDIMEGNLSLVEITAACDDRFRLKPGHALSVARHLIANHIWPVDLTVPIDLRKPIKVGSAMLVMGNKSSHLA